CDRKLIAILFTIAYRKPELGRRQVERKRYPIRARIQLHTLPYRGILASGWILVADSNVCRRLPAGLDLKLRRQACDCWGYFLLMDMEGFQTQLIPALEQDRLP